MQTAQRVRTAERFNEDGTVSPCSFDDLKKDDIFRLFEPDGRIVPTYPLGYSANVNDPQYSERWMQAIKDADDGGVYSYPVLNNAFQIWRAIKESTK